VALEALSHQDVDAGGVEPVDEAHEDEHNGVEAELGHGDALEAAHGLGEHQLENGEDHGEGLQEDSSDHAGEVDPPAEPPVLTCKVEPEGDELDD